MIDGHDAEKINAILKAKGKAEATISELASVQMGRRGYAGVASEIIKARKAAMRKA